MQRPAALVTGGAKRLGRSIALALAEEGYDIALHYNSSKADAEKTAFEITSLGVSCMILPADLSGGEAVCEALVDLAFQALPRIEVLVNNASIFERGSLEQTSEDLLARHMRINFEAPLFLSKAFAARASEGAIVNMVDARVHQKKHPYMAYLLSKKALLGLTELTATDLAPDIRVNAVCPGFVIPASDHEKDYEERLSARLPMQRVATPQEVTEAVLMLIRSPIMTGQSIFIDGGENLL